MLVTAFEQGRALRLSACVLAVLMSSQQAARAQSATPPSGTAAAGELDEIVVTGIRRSLEDALEAKRAADSIVDGISAEDIGDFPDENLAESLQRVTGVQIERNAGEGTSVSIRGLGPQFNRVVLNGRTAPSDAGERDFNFLVLSSELVSSIAVAKSTTADIAEGGVGGTVFVETPKPLDIGERRLTGSAFAQYDFQREEYAPRASGLWSQTFADQTFGVLLSASYSERKFANQIYNQNGYIRSPANFQNFATAQNLTRPVFEPENVQIDATETDRERTNVYGVLQWAPNESLRLTLDTFYSRFEDFTFRTRLQIPPNRGGYVPLALESAPDGDLTLIDVGNSFSNVDNRNFDSQSELMVSGLNARWESGNLRVDADVAYSDATRDRETLATIIDIPRGATRRTVFDYRSGNRLPDISFFNYDPGNYASHILRFIRVDRTPASDEEYSGRLDFTVRMDGDLVESLQAGVRYSDRTFGTNETTTNNCNFNPCITGLTPGIQNVLPANAPIPFPVDDFLGDEPGGFPRTWATADPILLTQHFLPNGLPTFVSRPAAFVEVDEAVTAAYLRVNFRGEAGVPFAGNVGLRYVSTDFQSAGFVPTPTGLDTVSRPGDVTFLFSDPQLVSAKRKYSELLWSANARFDLRDDLLLRLAAGRVMSRPEIGFLSPGFAALSPENRTVTSGNPELDPFLATQFDASVEWYTGRTSAVTLAFFYKDIDAVTQTLTTLLPISFGGVTQNYNFTRPENSDGGNIWGAEVAVQRTLDFLPAPFDNFGVVANYTYADSSITSRNPVVSDREFALEGLSKHNGNLILFYEDERFGFRAAYNYRDEYLDQTLGAFQLPEFRDASRQLDLSASYRLTPQLSLSVEALNVLDDEQFQYSGDPSRVRFVEYSGPRVMLGLRGTY